MMSDDSFASGASSGSSSATSMELLQRPVPDSPFSGMSKSGDDDDDMVDAFGSRGEDDEEDDACCCSCRKPIKERHLLKVRGFHRPWHVRCLRCSVCQVPLEAETSCFYRGRNIYCKTDYIGHRSRAFKCSKCQRVLGPTDWVRKARDHMYHLACFACDACKRQLSTGEEFALHDDRLLCKTHYVETATGGSENDGEDGSGQKQKTKRVRTSFTEEQLRILHANFRIDSNPDGQDLERIAQQTGLSKRVTQVWFQNSRARQKKHQQTSSSSTSANAGTIHGRLSGALGGNGAGAVINPMASPSSPTHGLVQSVVSHHPSAAAVAVLSAAAAASYMNINLRGGATATAVALHQALQQQQQQQHQHQHQAGNGSSGHMAPTACGNGQLPVGPAGLLTAVSAAGTPNFDGQDNSTSPRPPATQLLMPVSTVQAAEDLSCVARSEAEDKSIGGLQSAAVQSAVSVPMSVTPPDLALIHAAIHGYRTGQHQHQQQHQMPTAGAAAFQMTEQRRSPGTAAATLMPSLFSPPSSSPATSPPRRLLYAAAAAAAAAGIHFRRPVQRRLDVETAAADENDGECYFYDDDDEDIDGMQTAAAAADDDDANVEASCFVSRQRRGVRSPDSCIDHGFADYYSQTEGDLSLFA